MPRIWLLMLNWLKARLHTSSQRLSHVKMTHSFCHWIISRVPALARKGESAKPVSCAEIIPYHREKAVRYQNEVVGSAVPYWAMCSSYPSPRGTSKLSLYRYHWCVKQICLGRVPQNLRWSADGLLLRTLDMDFVLALAKHSDDL